MNSERTWSGGGGGGHYEGQTGKITDKRNGA